MTTNITHGFPRKILLINKMSGENIEMEGGEDFDYVREAERAVDNETSFTEDRPGDKSTIIIDTSNPLFVGPDAPSTSNAPGGSVPNVGRDVGIIKRYVIYDKKQFIKIGLGATINKGDGPNSTLLYDRLKTVTGKKGEINGATYKGKKIIILKDGKMEYSTDRTKVLYVAEFKELLRKASIENDNSPAGRIKKQINVDVPQDVVNDVINNVNERLESEISDRVENITTNTEITANKLRELRGILNVKGASNNARVEALKVESEHWKKESEKEEAKGNAAKTKLYDAIKEVADLKADQIRLKLNQQPVTKTVIDMIKNETETNDLTKLERFKKWAKENLVGLSAIAIGMASIITSVVMAGRNAVKAGASAVKKFAKAVLKMAKKFGPVLSILGTIISNIIMFIAKWLLWMSQNLWMLALALTYLVYNEYRNYRAKQNKTK